MPPHEAQHTREAVPLHARPEARAGDEPFLAAGRAGAARADVGVELTALSHLASRRRTLLVRGACNGGPALRWRTAWHIAFSRCRGIAWPAPTAWKTSTSSSSPNLRR